MKTTKFYIVVFLMFLFSNSSLYAQYNGSSADGSSTDNLSTTSCSIPAHFYAYFGGSDDGAGTETLNATTCGTPAHFFAYFGGTNDGAAVETISTTTCGTPAQFYAYFGGDTDGAATETISAITCAFPPQFYAYFGGSGDGFSLDKTTPICPTQPPVAGFTASSTQVCVGQTITFTDSSTNIPAGWTWTFPGGTPNTATVQNPVVTYNTPGVYNVTLVAANYNGTDTITQTGYITVYAYPSVTTTTPASRCDAGSVTLQATTNVGTLNWYANSTGGTAIGTGTSFTTPSIAATTTYYVESLNGVCSSTRSAVIATVNTTPTITATIPNSRCDAGSVILNATSNAGSTIWYNSPTGGTPLATTNNFTTPSIGATTTYYVEASAVNCTSPRTAVVATVNTTPTITATTPASVCDSGIVTLNATASDGTVTWYDASTGGTLLETGSNYTTPNLTATTNYYVQAATATCASGRILVVATVNQTPSITATTPSSVCNSGAVTLAASTNIGTLNWYTSASGGSSVGSGNSYTTPLLNTTTTYYVASENGGCTSAREPVTATVNTSPTITSTTGASVCGQGGGTLTATASSGTIYWYSVATGGTSFYTGTSLPVSGGSYTFYAEAISNGCISPRVPVQYTYIPIPVITSVGSASRCGAGSVTLTASSDSGTISWYDAPSGGNLVATGTSFTTPNLNATTTYYVEATNGTCGSTSRSAITATVSITAPPIATANQTFCNGEVVSNIVVTPTGSSIIWYDTATGGNVVSNSTAIVSGTTYYASQTISGCESTVRTPVTMTLGGCLGNDSFEVSEIKLFPNPIIDFVTISSIQTIIKVEVLNVLGQLMFVKSTHEAETPIDMSNYASGSYLIRVFAEDTKVQTFKVIKK